MMVFTLMAGPSGVGGVGEAKSMSDGAASSLTPKSVRDLLTRRFTSWALSARVDLRRLKLISVVLPIVFALVLEFAVFAIAEGGLVWHSYHVIFIALTISSIAAFSFVMFQFINGAQQQVLRQNRELAATNAVSNAVQGELGVDRIIEVALESVLAWSGATEVSVTVFTSQDPAPDVEGGTHYRRVQSPPITQRLGSSSSVETELVEIPLYTGVKVVGRMRLRLPTSLHARDGLGSGTLQNIGHQLADAIQLAQLVVDLERRNQEGSAFHDVLLQISNQSALADILASVVRQARHLVGSDEAVLCLNEDVSRSFQLEGISFTGDGTASISTESGHLHNVHVNHLVCPIRSSPQWRATLTVPLRGPAGTLGDVWIARRSNVPFTAGDSDYLEALSGLATIALTSAQARENEYQGTILAERERIAREMHDSLAQVLGVIHLRLRALFSHREIKDTCEAAAEVAGLADICQEAYRDVREAILGLRQSSGIERGLLDSLRAYLTKYSHQCGIETSLECDLDHDLTLSPRSEVQMIRVIQEALTNVRKHSGAKSAIVRVSESSSSTTFVVEDDGHGFDPLGSLSNRDAFGLFTMRERMELLNGSLVIDSAPGCGTRIIAVVPERSYPRPIPQEVTNASA